MKNNENTFLSILLSYIEYICLYNKLYVSEYVYISSLGSRPLDDQGFEIMQLASGLTLSDTVIKTISSSELSGTLFI